MRKWVLIVFILLVLGYAAYLYLSQQNDPAAILPRVQNGGNQSISATPENLPRIAIFAEGLDTPWAIAFLPGGDVLVTERPGQVRFISSSGVLQETPALDVSNVKETSEGGLHGIALHPAFSTNNFIYLYYTYGGSGGNTLNRVSRYTFDDNTLSNEEILIDAIPGSSNHDGGRIAFGPDGFLYITTGDAQEPSLAQNTGSLAGKILRVTDTGDAAPGNPFGNRVYSYGHRNPQGITWDDTGQLWAAEHGPSGFETGNDELNKIEKGGNFGWPEVRGKQTRDGMIAPVVESGTSETWAPAGLAFNNGSLFFAGLRGQTLYEVKLSDPTNVIKHLVGEYGRLRAVVNGPEGLLYISTSNRDGRGRPDRGDDKILRINPEKL